MDAQEIKDKIRKIFLNDVSDFKFNKNQTLGEFSRKIFKLFNDDYQKELAKYRELFEAIEERHHYGMRTDASLEEATESRNKIKELNDKIIKLRKELK